MRKTAYTPGPWQQMPEEVDKSYIRIRGTRLGMRFKIANVPSPSYDGAHEREAQETRANARLIAAAPELLEALLRCRFDSLNMSMDDMRACQAAIAKATGETPC
jgi:hypothetical protein